MAFEFHHRRRVYWQDTDIAGIIHFTNYFRYMEEAEAEFHRSLGVHALEVARKEGIYWPRVAASCDFRKTVTYGDELDVHLRVSQKGHSSIAYEFSFKHDGVEVAHGRLSVACVEKDASGRMKAVPIPKVLHEALQVAPPVAEVDSPR